MVDADTTVASQRDYRLQEEEDEDNRSQLSQTSDLWETSGVRMSALCLNVLHDISDAASQCSNSDRDASEVATKKGSRRKGIADFFRLSKRRSKSKKRKADTAGLNSDSSAFKVAEDKAARKVVQHGDSAPIPSGKEKFSHKAEQKLRRDTDATTGNFDVSVQKSTTLPLNIKGDKQHSDFKKTTKLESDITKGSKRSMLRGNTLPPPRVDQAEEKRHRLARPLKLLETNIQKMVANVNRKFPSRDDKGRSSGRAKGVSEGRKDDGEQTNKDQSFVSKREENKVRSNSIDVIVRNDPIPAAGKNTANEEQKTDQQLGSGKVTSVTRHSPTASPRGRPRGGKARRGRSAEVPTKKGRRIRRRTLSREWVLTKTTTTEDTTFIKPVPKKLKVHHPPPNEPILAALSNNEIEANAESPKTKRNTNGLLCREGLTKGVPDPQNDMNNNDSIDDLPADGSGNWTAGIVDWLQKNEQTFPFENSDPTLVPSASYNKAAEGSFTDLNIPTELEMKTQSETTSVDHQTPAQALVRTKWPQKDEPTAFHITPQFTQNPASSISQNHSTSPDSHIPTITLAKESDSKNSCPVTAGNDDQLSSTQVNAGKKWPEQDELDAFQTASQFSAHPVLTTTQKDPAAAESYFSAMNMSKDMNITNQPSPTDVNQLAGMQVLLRKHETDDPEIDPEHGTFSNDERLISATEKPRWNKRKPAIRSRNEFSAFGSSNAADDPMPQTNRDERFPKIFSGVPMTADGSPFDCKMVKRNDSPKSRPKPRWTKRKPATRGRRQSPSRGEGDAHNTSMFELTATRSKPFFFGDASAVSDRSPFDVAATHNDREPVSGPSKPRWTKRKPASRGKRPTQLDGDKPTYPIGGSRNEPFSNTGGFHENYDLFGVDRRVPGFAEEVFVGREPLFHEAGPMFFPVFTNDRGIEEPLFPVLSLNDDPNSRKYNSPVTGRSQFVDDPRSSFEPEFFWNAQLTDEVFSPTSVGKVPVTDTSRSVASQGSKDPAFFWNAPVNDESSDCEDRNDVSFYGDAEVSDDLSASEVIPDTHEPSFFWNTHVDDDTNNTQLASSSRDEPLSLHEQTEVFHDQPFSDFANKTTNDSPVVQFTDDVTEESSVPDTSQVFPAANHDRTELSEENTEDTKTTPNAQLPNVLYTEKSTGDIMRTSSEQPSPAKHAIDSESIQYDCATDDNIIPHVDSGYSSVLSNASQNQSIGQNPCNRDTTESSLPSETMERQEDKSIPSVDNCIGQDNEDNDKEHTLVKEQTNMPVHESDGNDTLTKISHKSDSVQDAEKTIPDTECPESGHGKTSDEMQASGLPQEDNSSRKQSTTEQSSATKQNGDELKTEPIADSTSSSASHPGVNFRSGSRQSVDGERARKGRGSLVEEGRTASPLLKWDSGSGQIPSPRHSASEAQLRDWSNRRHFSTDDDRSSPMMYFPRRLNVDLPYSDSGYSETEAETLSPCSFRSSISRAETVTGEEGRYDSIADDDSRFTFQITDETMSSWLKPGRTESEKESIDCFSPDSGLQTGDKVDEPWSLGSEQYNHSGVIDESVFVAYQSNENVPSYGSEIMPQEKREGPPLREITSHTQGQEEFQSESGAKINSFGSPASESESMAEAGRDDELVPTSHRQGHGEFKRDSDAKMDSLGNKLSGSESIAETQRDNELAPTSQRQGQAEFKRNSDAKMDSLGNPLSGCESMAEARRDDELAPRSQIQGQAEFKRDSDAKMDSFVNPLSESESMAEARRDDELAPISQRQGQAEFKRDSDAKMDSFGNPLPGSASMAEARRDEELAPRSQRQGQVEFERDIDAKMDSFGNPLTGSESMAENRRDEVASMSQRRSQTDLKRDSKTQIDSLSGSELMAESRRDDKIALTSQIQSQTEFKRGSDAKLESFGNTLTGSESMAEARSDDEFAPTSQRQGQAEFVRDSDAKMNSDSGPVSRSVSLAESRRYDEFAETSHRYGQGQAELKRDNDLEMNSLESSISGSGGSKSVEHKQPQLDKEIEQSCKAQDRLVLEMQTLSEYDKETVDESIIPRSRKQVTSNAFAVPNHSDLVRSEEKAFDNKKNLLKETRHYDRSSSAEEETVVQNQTLPDEVLLVSEHDNQMVSETSNRYKMPVEEALVSFQRADNLHMGDAITGNALNSFTSQAKIEILKECAAEDASKSNNECALAYSSDMKQNEPLKCYIVPENERTDDKSVNRANKVGSELPVSVVKSELGSDRELFTWHEYAELHSIFRQFPNENDVDYMTAAAAAFEMSQSVDLSLLPSTWIWNGSRFLNYMSTANRDGTKHFSDSRPCRSISCSMQQDEFTLVDGASLRRQSLLSALERLQLSCSAEKEALIQIKALRSRIQESHSPAKEDLIKVKALLSKIQQSSGVWEEAHIQAKALLRKIQVSLSYDKEECNTLPGDFQVLNSSAEDTSPENEIQQSRSIEQDFIECSALLSQLQVLNSSEQDVEFQDEKLQNEIQQSRSIEQDFIECNALLSQLQVFNLSEDKVQFQDEKLQNEIQQSRSIEKDFVECSALMSQLQDLNSSEEEVEPQDEKLQIEIQQSRSTEQDFIECSALMSQLQVLNSSEDEVLLQHEKLQNVIQQSRSIVQDFIECSALMSQLQVLNSSEDEVLLQDENLQNEIQQSRSIEQDFIECTPLLSQLQVLNSSEDEALLQDEKLQNEIQQSRSTEKDFIECSALISQLQVLNSSEDEVLLQHEKLQNEIQQSRSIEQDFIECSTLLSQLQVLNSSEQEVEFQDEKLQIEIEQSRSIEQDFIECTALLNQFQVLNSTAVEVQFQDENQENEIQQSNLSEEQLIVGDKARSTKGQIKNDVTRERSISPSKISDDLEFSATEQNSCHNDHASAQSINQPSSSETLVTSSARVEAQVQRSQAADTDISSESESQLRLRSCPTTDDVDAAVDDVSPKQTKTIRSRRPVVCLLASTAGILSALLIFYISIHMNFIDI